MFDFHEKRKIRKVLYSKTVFVLLLIIVILLSKSVYSRFLVAEETKNRLEERKEDLKELEMRAETLDNKVQYLENDRGIEEELRNRFDVAKEGEQVVIILEDEDSNETESPNPSNIETEEKNGLFSIFNLFKFW